MVGIIKILIPVLGFGRSGGMRVLSQLATHFVNLGHSVDFLAPDDGINPYYPTSGSIKRYYYPFNRVPGLRYYAKMIFILIWLLRYRFEYSIVLANAYGTALPVAIGTRKRSNGFYYIQAYEVDFAKDSLFPFSIFDVWLARLSYKLKLTRIVNSGLYLSYKEISSKYVVEPGLDLSVFGGRSKVWSGNEPMTVGCIGRLEGWKGTQLVIDAVRQVRESLGIDVRLNVAFHLPRDFRPTNCDDFIVLSEPHGDMNLAEFYRKNDVFIAVGLIQSGAYHYPCMEAMASGVPVISNYAPLCAGDPLYIEEVSVTEIVNALRRFVEMGELDRGKVANVGLSKVISFSWDIVSRKMIDIFAKNIDD